MVETRLASSGFSHGQGLHSLGWRGPQPCLPEQLVSDGGLGEGLCPVHPVACRHSWLPESPPHPQPQRYSGCFLPCTQRQGRA